MRPSGCSSGLTSLSVASTGCIAAGTEQTHTRRRIRPPAPQRCVPGWWCPSYLYLHPSLLIMLLKCTQSYAQVVSWAQQQFLQEVSREKPDSSINLAKVCLLLALEEEAAANLPDATQARCGRAGRDTQ